MTPVTAPVTGPVPVLELAGDPAEIGRAHGRALAPALRSFVGDRLARVNALVDTPLTLAGITQDLMRHLEVIEADTPDLAEEVHGLADGAGLTLAEAVLLQVRREVIGFQASRSAADCTTYSRAGEHPVLAQTVDLNGDLDDVLAILSVARRGSPRTVLTLSFGGLLGYLGVNSDGLAVGINLVVGGRWRPGVPPYLAIRHVLDTAGSVDEAVEVLGSLRLASSRSLTLCDPNGTAFVEILDGERRVVRARATVHTNHFLHHEFAVADQVNVFARNSSIRRLDECAKRMAGLAHDASVDEHLALLSAPPLFVAPDGDVRRERTVAIVVLRPGERDLHVVAPVRAPGLVHGARVPAVPAVAT